jgi:hypothetical protein
MGRQKLIHTMQKLPEDAAFDNVRFAGYIKKI